MVAGGHVLRLHIEFEGDKSMRHDVVVCVVEGKIGSGLDLEIRMESHEEPDIAATSTA
jgi:hypothetical protein